MPHSVHRPKLADELGEQVAKLHAEVPPHVIGQFPDGLHLQGRAPGFQGEGASHPACPHPAVQTREENQGWLRGEGKSGPVPGSALAPEAPVWADPTFPLNRLHIPDHPAKITALESSEQCSAPDMHHRMESLEPSEADIIIIPNLQTRKLGHRES